MKRVLAIILILASLLSTAFAVDLTGMSYDELIELKDQINVAIWASQEWQEVTVPKGLWKIGEDIPVGYWTIRPVGQQFEIYYYGDKLDATGMSIDIWNCKASWTDIISTKVNKDGSWKDTDTYHEVSLDMKKGFYIYLPCDTIFTPYAGKPGFGFK